MDNIVSQIQDMLEGPIDFDGQRVSELICYILIPLTAVAAFLTGIVQEDIYLTLWVGLAGTILTMLVVVPPWPLFNQNPQPFIGSRKRLPAGGIVVGGKKVD